MLLNVLQLYIIVMQISPAPVSQIVFDKPKRSKDPPAINASHQMPSAELGPKISRDTLLNALHKVYPSAAVFSVVPGYQPVRSSTLSPQPLIPKLLTSIYDPKYSKMAEAEFHVAVQGIKIEVTDSEAEYLEKATKGQTSSTLWYDHRVGRITASQIGKVVKCAEMKFPTSIVNSIMQYKTLNPNIPALKWGRQSEENARQDYKMEMEKNHVDFEVQKAGLLISTKYPFLGATPDGIVSCSCCGTGLLEVKCPFKYRDSNPCEINDTSFYLQIEPDGTKSLNQAHDYYYQVQGQMAIWSKTYCDFVCWTTKGHVVTRIQYNEAFFEGFVGKCKHFFDTYLLPEIMSRKLQTSNAPEVSEADDALYCYCRAPEEPGNPMIGCDAPDCPIEWFHFSCVNISEEPLSDDEWFCDECKERLNM